MNGFTTVPKVVICSVILTDLMKIFVEFCVLKFSCFGWDHDGWRNKEWKEPKLGGAPWHPKLLFKEKQETKLGDAFLFLLMTIGILLGAIFLFVTYHEFCLGRLVLYESLLFFFLAFHKYPGWTHLFYRAKIMLWLIELLYVLHLKK